MRRLSDGVAEMVLKAIQELAILDIVRQEIEWEVLPFVGGGAVGWLIGIGLPTAGGDYEMPFGPLNDPHSQAETSNLVLMLYMKAAEKAAVAGARSGAPSNGGKASPGGLALPG
jgi:hypothetical protein